MKRNWNLLVLAWLIAAAATASALFIGEVMEMAPCVLCWEILPPVGALIGLAMTYGTAGSIFAFLC